MFIGHAAVALAAKPLAPRLPLAAALAAAWWIDLVWPVFLLLGIERVLIVPGITAFTPLNFIHYPWTHSLVAAAAWSVLFALPFLKLGKREALVVGLLVLSHWFLDAIVHRPDLPLWPGASPLIGLSLWNSIPGTVLLEGALFLAGLVIYQRATRPLDRTGIIAFGGLVALLLVSYVGTAFGPPPPSVHAIAYAGILGFGLTIALAWWAERHRAPA